MPKANQETYKFIKFKEVKLMKLILILQKQKPITLKLLTLLVLLEIKTTQQIHQGKDHREIHKDLVVVDIVD